MYDYIQQESRRKLMPRGRSVSVSTRTETETKRPFPFLFLIFLETAVTVSLPFPPGNETGTKRKRPGNETETENSKKYTNFSLIPEDISRNLHVFKADYALIFIPKRNFIEMLRKTVKDTGNPS